MVGCHRTSLKHPVQFLIGPYFGNACSYEFTRLIAHRRRWSSAV